MHLVLRTICRTKIIGRVDIQPAILLLSVYSHPGLFQMTVVDDVGIVGTGGYVGHFVAGVVQTVFGQFDIARFNAVLGQCDIVAYFHSVVVHGGVAGFDAVYYQVFFSA